jgi:3-hydroxyacyl-CoA dehydrogenase
MQPIQSLRHRRRRHGRRHRRAGRQCRRPGAAARHRAEGRGQPQRPGRRRGRPMLKTEPAPFMSARAAKLIECRQHRGPSGPLAEMRLDRRSRGGTPGCQTGAVPQARCGAPPRHRDVLEHQTIPLKTAHRRHATASRDFLITHFFNPPRYMRLMELVTGPKTDHGSGEIGRAVLRRLARQERGACKDSPGFIANRLGVYWMQAA